MEYANLPAMLLNRAVTRSLSAALLLLLACACPALSAPVASRSLQASDWYRLRRLSDPRVSPDGVWVAYVLAHVDSARDRYDSDLWMTRWDGSASVRLTTSDESESSPRWSPDGRTLAFLSKREGTKSAQEIGRASCRERVYSSV